MSNLIASILCILYCKAPFSPTHSHRSYRVPLTLTFQTVFCPLHIQYRALPVLTCQTESNLLPPAVQSPVHSYLSDRIESTPTCRTESCPLLPVRQNPASHPLSPFLTVLPTPACHTEPCPNLPVKEPPASLT